MPPPPSTPASIISDAIASLTQATDEALSKSEEQARAELARALSEARQAKNQRDEALNSLKALENEQADHRERLDTWKEWQDKADLTIQDQADTIAQLREESIQWKGQYARVEKSCQEWKEQFMRVERERIRLSAELEQALAERDLFQGSVDGSLLDDCGEHATSPPSSSTSTKIGSVTVEQPLAKRRQLEAAVNRPQKASGPRKSTGKPPAGGTKTQAKTGTNTSRPAKGKGTLNQKPSQNGEGSASKGPVQRLIRRVHATVEVPIKVEDEEEKLVDSLANDKKADKDPKLSTAIEKAPRFTEQSRMNNKTLPLHVDDDSTPPAPGPLPKRRKSGIERDHNERDKNVYNWRNQEDVNFRHRPPPRRKSIRELRDSDFEYHEREDEEGEDSDTDELNLGHGVCLERSTKQQRANGKSSLPTQKTGKKRKAVDAMDVDEPVVSRRGSRKAVKTR